MDNLIIFGNEKLQKESYYNGKFEINNSALMKLLYSSYEVDNLSNSSLTTKKALNLLNQFVKYFVYDKCIICLGANETINDEFYYNMERLVITLHEKCIETIIFDIDNNTENGKLVNPFLRDLRTKYSVADNVTDTKYGLKLKVSF